MRISDWSSDVCSSDLVPVQQRRDLAEQRRPGTRNAGQAPVMHVARCLRAWRHRAAARALHRAIRVRPVKETKEMIEAIQVAADAAQANPAASKNGRAHV